VIVIPIAVMTAIPILAAVPVFVSPAMILVALDDSLV
jgi:hypothetical protein